MLEILVNGESVQADERKTVLEILRGRGIKIPSLCFHPALSTAGSCRLCGVEAASPGKEGKIRLSCALHPKEGMEIRTDTEAVRASRLKAFSRLVRYAPESSMIRNLAREYGLDLGPAPDECIRCRLCTRVCKEIVGAGALVIRKIDGDDRVFPREGNHCIGCGTCVNICPTGVIKMKDEGFFRIISIRDEIIGKNPLVRCEACGNLFATQKFLSRVEKKTDEHPHVKGHHLYCPTCAKLFSDRIQSVVSVKRVKPPVYGGSL